MRALKIFEIMLLIGFIIFLFNSVSFGAELKQKRRVQNIDFTKAEKPKVQIIEFNEPLEIVVIKSTQGVSK